MIYRPTHRRVTVRFAERIHPIPAFYAGPTVIRTVHHHSAPYTSSMRPRRPLLPLLFLLPLATSCSAVSSLLPDSLLPDLDGNWQIQSAAGASTNSTPTAGVLMLGSLKRSGTAVTGTFRFSNLSASIGSCPLNQVVTLSGTVDATQVLKLTSAPFSGSTITLQVVVASALGSTGAGTITVTGPAACAYPSSPALGLHFAPITGTYTGKLASNPAGSTATTALSLIQGTSANPDGQLPLTGSVQVTDGTCTSTTALSGTVSGLQVTAASAPAAPLGVTNANLAAVVALPSSSLQTSLSFLTGPCSTGLSSFMLYSGTLTKQ